jgi:uroporphyrinogen-III synthase
MPSLGEMASLNGAGVLVTRAAHQAEPLCALIEAHGGRAIRLPALEIEGPADPAGVAALLDRLPEFQIAIFISPNAVESALALLGHRPLPAHLVIGAVGQGSARALRARGIQVHLAPAERFDSEGLLELPELRSLKGSKIVIFRGDGGRPLLGETLRERGALVEYAEVYRRHCPEIDPLPLLTQWESQVQIATATSAEILDNLFHILGPQGAPLLRDTPLVVIGARMAARAARLGCSRIHIAPRADDQTLLSTLLAAI